MQVIALRSAGLPAKEITEAAAEVGVTVTVVTSLEEAETRGLSRARVIVDGVGETADELRALGRLGDELERVFWIGFEPPNRRLPGLALINPLNQIEGLIEALEHSSAHGAETMVPIVLADDVEVAPAEGQWDLPVLQPPTPVDRPLPTLAPMTLHLEEQEEIEERVVDADFQVQRAWNWKLWVPPVMSTCALVLVAFLLVRSSYEGGKTIALPEPVTTMPDYAMEWAQSTKNDQSVQPKIKIKPSDLPPNTVLVTPSQKTPPAKKAQRVVTPFDESPLKECLKGLGKKGKKWLRKNGSVRVNMRLGIMGDGRVVAATTRSVRIGRKTYRSSRFNACVEGKVVGQQMSIRPEREPTFIKRIFKIAR